MYIFKLNWNIYAIVSKTLKYNVCVDFIALYFEDGIIDMIFYHIYFTIFKTMGLYNILIYNLIAKQILFAIFFLYIYLSNKIEKMLSDVIS